MIKVLVGIKGSGKTAKLVDEMNTEAANSEKNIVCIVRGDRLDTQIKPQIRLIDMNEYPARGYDEFMGFLSGIYAENYDITDIYVDSIQKVTKTDDLSGFEGFLTRVEEFSKSKGINITIILSADPDTLPEGIREYCEAA